MLSLHTLRNQKKEEQTKLKASKGKEIIKTEAEIE